MLAAFCAAAVVMLVVGDVHSVTQTELESRPIDPSGLSDNQLENGSADELVESNIDMDMKAMANANAGASTRKSSVDSSSVWYKMQHDAAKAAHSAKKMRHVLKKEIRHAEKKKAAKALSKEKDAQKAHTKRKKLRKDAAKSTAKEVSHALQHMLTGSSELASKAAIASAKQTVAADKKKHHAIEVLGKTEAKKKMKLQYLVDRLKGIRNEIHQIQQNAATERVMAKKAAEKYAKKVERHVHRIKVQFNALQAKLAKYHLMIATTKKMEKSIGVMKGRLRLIMRTIRTQVVKIHRKQDVMHKEKCKKADAARRVRRKRRAIRRKMRRRMKRVRRAIAKEKKRRSQPDVDGLDILNKDKLSIVASSKVIKEQKAKIAKKQITLQKSFKTNEKLHKLDRKRAGILKIARNAYRTMEKARRDSQRL
jgi:hypothetical protein